MHAGKQSKLAKSQVCRQAFFPLITSPSLDSLGERNFHLGSIKFGGQFSIGGKLEKPSDVGISCTGGIS